MSSSGTTIPSDHLQTTFSRQLITHRAHSYKLLLEGTVSARLEYDFVHGSSSHNTSFRNYFSGTEPNATNYRTPWEADAHNRYMNAVANVLGDSSYQTAYECTLATRHGRQRHDDLRFGLDRRVRVWRFLGI